LALRNSLRNRGLETVVDDHLGGRDLCRLLRRQRAAPTEHLPLKRAAVIERKNIEGFVKSDTGHKGSFIFRYRRMRVFVELSCARLGSASLSNSGMMRWASALPSSTPH